MGHNHEHVMQFVELDHECSAALFVRATDNCPETRVFMDVSPIIGQAVIGIIQTQMETGDQSFGHEIVAFLNALNETADLLATAADAQDALAGVNDVSDMFSN